MARSYKGRRNSRRRDGLLVRESNVQRGVNSNSLFSVPFKATVPTGGAILRLSQTSSKASVNLLDTPTFIGNAASIGGRIYGLIYSDKFRLVRFSSMVVASATPCKVRVLNAAGGYSVYQISGGKPTKIVFSQTSLIGNAATLRATYYNPINGTTENTLTLVEVVGSEDDSNVDITLNAVLDNDAD